MSFISERVGNAFVVPRIDVVLQYGSSCLLSCACIVDRSFIFAVNRCAFPICIRALRGASRRYLQWSFHAS
jgi:hypothetical protein